MRAVVQRVSKASVVVDDKITGKIGLGFLVLLGVAQDDELADIEWLVRKIIGLRVFSDEAGKMNKSLVDVNGEVLVVSQFTLHASTKKGNRPSFINAAPPDLANELYERFNQEMEQQLNKPEFVQAGIFGADMKVELLNDGPVTILFDTKNKE